MSLWASLASWLKSLSTFLVARVRSDIYISFRRQKTQMLDPGLSLCLLACNCWGIRSNGMSWKNAPCQRLQGASTSCQFIFSCLLTFLAPCEKYRLDEWICWSHELITLLHGKSELRRTGHLQWSVHIKQRLAADLDTRSWSAMISKWLSPFSPCCILQTTMWDSNHRYTWNVLLRGSL